MDFFKGVVGIFYSCQVFLGFFRIFMDFLRDLSGFC